MSCWTSQIKAYLSGNMAKAKQQDVSSCCVAGCLSLTVMFLAAGLLTLIPIFSDEFGPQVAGVLGIVVFIYTLVSLGRDERNLIVEIRAIVQAEYNVQACSRCLESHMQLLSCSTNAKSIEYECLHCGKKSGHTHSHQTPPDCPRIFNN